MLELNELHNVHSMTTNLCRECAYCVIFESTRECEQEKFVPVDETKSYRYTSIDFDCISYLVR